jgi:hypothetical protein
VLRTWAMTGFFDWSWLRKENPEGFTILVKKHIVKINYYSCSSTEKPSGFSGGQPIALKTKNLNQPLEAVIHFSWLQPTVLMNQRFKLTSDCLKIHVEFLTMTEIFYIGFNFLK